VVDPLIDRNVVRLIIESREGRDDLDRQVLVGQLRGRCSVVPQPRGRSDSVESHASPVHVFGKPCQFGVIKPCLKSIIYTRYRWIGPSGGVMLESAALVGFVGVSDLVRARHFYGDQLGLPLRDETPFALVAEAGGTMLRITAVDEVAPVPYTVLGWSVSDVDATIDHLVSRGVTFTRYEAMNQDQRGVWTAPGGSRIAWFLDPDGNNLSLTEFADPG
jgi:catechol 2,3-dioxygenase-like lactoylglutathione lyase family enzyme